MDATIAANLESVRSRIDDAARRVGRDPSDVLLIAVSKTFGSDHVRAARLAGQRDFGENKVQEALQKISDTSDKEIRWHLIGHLQSNKARRAVQLFDAEMSIAEDPERTSRLIWQDHAFAGLPLLTGG